MNGKLNLNEVLIFSLTFSLFVIIGTITHELGHLAVAHHFGYKGTLHYGSCSWKDPALYQEQLRLKEKYGNLSLATEEERRTYMDLSKKRNAEHAFWITVGGPVQSILVGMIGLLILFWRYHKRTKNRFKFLDWLAVYLAFFWSRGPFNLFGSVTKGLFLDRSSLFGGDERKISLYLGLGEGTVPVVMALLGMAVCAFVLFKMVPREQLKSFMVGGFIGGLGGFYFWFKFLGPFILP